MHLIPIRECELGMCETDTQLRSAHKVEANASVAISTNMHKLNGYRSGGAAAADRICDLNSPVHVQASTTWYILTVFTYL